MTQEMELEVHKVRTVFEENNKYLSETFFGYFPEGACGNASCFLAKWLEYQGVVGLRYICGKRDGHSHAWLEIDDCIIDITSDQFPDGVGSVYIGRDRSFHDQFIDQQEGDKGISSVVMGAFNKFWELAKNA